MERHPDTLINLTQMKPGQSGVVAELRGGHGFMRRIHNMGIRPGKKIKKMSSHFWQGPQTVMIDNLRVAVGFGIAKKIFVEIEKGV